jgi:peptide/nickel transport system substrate-binding protein
MPPNAMTIARRIITAGLALVTAIAVAGCEPSGKENGRVRWAWSMPTSWDPVTSRTGADINTVSLAYASLTRLDKAGNVEPALAESWRYSDDGLALTFELRKGLTFTDNTPLDAAAVKAFFERAKTQKDSFIRSDLENVESISADGAASVTLHLKEPDYQLPYLMAGRVGAIASPTAARDAAKLALWPVGAGPFRITKFVPESSATFEKNPGYWDAANIHIDQLELLGTPDPSTVIAALQSGSLDVAGRLPARRVEEAESAGLTVVTAPSLQVAVLSINRNKPPFDNPKVVEAFRYAFDRQEFVNTLTAGRATVTHQPFPKDYFAFSPEVENIWPYDPKRAAALLREAGYAPDALSIEIATNPLTNQGAPEIILAQLARIGVKAKLRVIPPGSSSWQSEVYIAKAPQAAFDGTVGRESPVQNLLTVYGPAGLMNLSGPSTSEAFMRAVDEVRRTPTDDPAYHSRLQAAVRIGVEQSPAQFLFSSPWVVAARPRVKNLNLLPTQIRWEGVRLE